MARRKETASLKSIDIVIGGMLTNHQVIAPADGALAP
jgi:hypothetical protein